MKIQDLHARAGRPATLPRPLVAGVFVTVATVVSLARPADAGDLRKLVERLAGQEHAVRSIPLLRQLVGKLLETVRARRRAHLERHLNERRFRHLGAEGAPDWGFTFATGRVT